MRKEQSLAMKWLFFIVGVMINSFGISLITKSILGTSPISSVPYVLCLRFSFLSFGMTTFVVNSLFILIQIVLLRKEFKPIQFLQFGINILFSVMIDISMGILFFVQPETWITQLITLILGCFILAFGIVIEVSPKVMYVPGEGAVQAISNTFHLNFGHTKMGFDLTLMSIALILSFIFFGRLNGLGIGTILSAILVGQFVNMIQRILPLNQLFTQ